MFVGKSVNKPEIICVPRVKCFQDFLSDANNSISYKSFVCTQLTGFKYCF